MIALRSLEITAEIKAEAPHGVVVAQGGREQGFALHFINGRPAFDVRINGTVNRIVGDVATGKTQDLRAMLSKEGMSLEVNGKLQGVGRVPGLIPVQPKDGLSIGRDDLSAAGDYEAPNPFNGTIVSARVEPLATSAD